MRRSILISQGGIPQVEREEMDQRRTSCRQQQQQQASLSLSFSRGGALSIYLARGTNAHSNNNLWEARSKARSEGGRRERDDAAIESRTERRMGCNEGGEASGQVKERY